MAREAWRQTTNDIHQQVSGRRVGGLCKGGSGARSPTLQRRKANTQPCNTPQLRASSWRTKLNHLLSTTSSCVESSQSTSPHSKDFGPTHESRMFQNANRFLHMHRTMVFSQQDAKIGRKNKKRHKLNYRTPRHPLRSCHPDKKGQRYNTNVGGKNSVRFQPKQKGRPPPPPRHSYVRTCPKFTGAPASAAKALNSLQTVGPALEDFISLKAGISNSSGSLPCGGSTAKRTRVLTSEEILGSGFGSTAADFGNRGSSNTNGGSPSTTKAK